MAYTADISGFPYWNSKEKEIGAFKKLLTIHNETMEENIELKDQLEDDTRQVHQLFAENEALKRVLKLANDQLEEQHKQILKLNELKEENKKLQEENKELNDYYVKWSPVLADIDGDEFCDLLQDYGWEYNDECELVNINVDYEEEEVDYYIDAARKVVLKDGRIVKTK